MKNIMIILAFVSGLVAALTSLKKSDHDLTGYVIANSSEMEATWYPE